MAKYFLAISIILLTQGCALTPEQRASMAEGFRAVNEYNNSPAGLQQQRQIHAMQMQMFQPQQPAYRLQTTCNRIGDTVFCN